MQFINIVHNIKYKMQITTCSPVFIGSGEEISSGEFLKDSNYIYIPYKKDLSQIVTSDDALFANYNDLIHNGCYKIFPDY